jgi:hypothetical protein
LAEDAGEDSGTILLDSVATTFAVAPVAPVARAAEVFVAVVVGAAQLTGTVAVAVAVVAGVVRGDETVAVGHGAHGAVLDVDGAGTRTAGVLLAFVVAAGDAVAVGFVTVALVDFPMVTVGFTAEADVPAADLGPAVVPVVAGAGEVVQVEDGGTEVLGAAVVPRAALGAGDVFGALGCGELDFDEVDVGPVVGCALTAGLG